MINKNSKYIALALSAVGFIACNDDIEPTGTEIEAAAAIEVTSGSADFSKFVALGNSLTAGFMDGALYKAGQEFSAPNLLAQQFAKAGGGEFTQPLMNDNVGGLLANGVQIQGPRLVFGGAGPVPLQSLNPNAAPTTDIVTNNPSGPFNNLGVPGAKSFHLLGDSYGDLAGVAVGTANPYAVRITGGAGGKSLLTLATDQNPTFFSLWIGNNDVLGYATSGADGTNPLTPLDGPIGVGFTATYNTLVGALTADGAKGIVANIADVTSIPFFTTVPYNPLDPSNPDFGNLIGQLNGIFGATINNVFDAVGQPERKIVFSADAANAVVIQDESLVDLSQQIAGALAPNPMFIGFVQSLGLPAQAAPTVAALLGSTYGQSRQATADDLLVLTSSGVIGQPNTDRIAALIGQGLPAALAGQFSVEGITLPLADKWVLIPAEQEEIATATAAYNATILAAANAADLAFFDANTVLRNLTETGVQFGDFTLTGRLVTGGAFSLDGVHPGARGYGLTAFEMLKAIDAKYGSNFILAGAIPNAGDLPTNFSPMLQ